MGIHNADWALPNQKVPILLNDEGDKAARRRGFALSDVGQLLNSIFPKSNAECLGRTIPALRIARRAQQCAEFHQRLIEV